MFAMFGLGWGEVIVLGLICTVMIAVPLAIIFVVIGVSRTSRGQAGPSEVVALREEAARLREENDRLRRAMENKDPPGPAS